MRSRCWYYLGSKANVTGGFSITIAPCLPTINWQRLTRGFPGEYLKMGKTRPRNAEARIWSRPAYFEFLVDWLRLGQVFLQELWSSLSYHHYSAHAPFSHFIYQRTTLHSKKKKNHLGRNRAQHSYIIMRRGTIIRCWIFCLPVCYSKI